MKFCKGCGKTLSILDDSPEDLCTQCTPKPQLQSQKSKKASLPTDLNGATLAYEDGKFILKSQEGWLLWSGKSDEHHSLQVILKHASRIHKIRSKNKK